MPLEKKIIIIPTYNEKENISSLVPKIFYYLPDSHILFIDDNSPDGTAKVIQQFQKTIPQIHLIQRPSKGGLGSAYIQGFKWALKNHYEYIFEMDGDFSHHPKYLADLLKAAQTHDLVLGSRYIYGGGVENWNILRRILSKSGSFYSRFLLSLPYKDLTGGFKCFRSHVLKSLDLDRIQSEGYCFQIELTYKTHQKGFKISEIPIIFTERCQGKSKISRKIVFEALWKVPLLRFCKT